MGIKRTNDLTALYFIFNNYGYSKKICLASHLLSLFFERNELLEIAYKYQKKINRRNLQGFENLGGFLYNFT